MNRDTVAGNWKQLKGRMKVQWGKLTGSHVKVVEGKGVELAGKVQEGQGDAKDAAKQRIEELYEWTKK
jgi:uncharacterized protein YjbJ (UPF0337 family)